VILQWVQVFSGGRGGGYRILSRIWEQMPKWARIAMYLSGRTGTDVKNFCSRQKRLARILQTSGTPPSSSNSKQQKPILK
jgi:hypothetical protein